MKALLIALLIAPAALAQQTVTLQPGQSVTIVAAAASKPGANLLAAGQLPVSYTCTTNWYVDVSKGNDANDGKTAATAWQHLIRGLEQNVGLAPGGCVNAAPGTYNEDAWIKTSSAGGGTAGSPIVLRSTTKGAAIIAGNSGSNGSTVVMPASYAIIDGFTVTTQPNKVANGAHCIDGGYNWQNGNHAHHLTAINNIVSGCGGAGISFVGADYYTIVSNTVSGNAGTNWLQASGISIATLWDLKLSDAPTYHNVIAYNISHDNLETWSCSTAGQSQGCHSDGEGIIIDCADCLDPSGQPPYPYKTLVVGNVVYRNGGNGIQTGRSSNVVVANNTSYNNMLDTQNGGSARSELGNFRGSNNTFVNNVAQAVASNDYSMLDEGAGSQGGTNYPATGNLWTNNLYFGGKGLGNIWPDANGVLNLAAALNIAKDPQLVITSGVPAGLQTTSPAIGTGFPEGFTSSTNIGAY